MDVDEVRALEDLPPRVARESASSNGAAPVQLIPVEPRSRRDDEMADALRALADKPAPVVNVDVRGATKRTVLFSNGKTATIEETGDEENTTNGHVEVT